MSFDSFLQKLQTSGWPEATCLIAQVALTLFIILNIRKNYNRFPIKQLSPICTVAALAAFLVINVISVIGRQIEQNNGYFDFSNCNVGQCRIYKKPGMQFLALTYAALRDFPLMIFALKTVRVSICFLNKQPPRWVVFILKSQLRIIAISTLYIIVIIIASLIDMQVLGGINQNYSQLSFQFLCPKQSGILDWITVLFRYTLLFISYTLSIKSYKELDFKKFIFLIFTLSNTQILLRALLVFNGVQQTSYHQFYYHSLLLHLFGTLLLLPYSNFNLNVNQPPGSAVLENFQAFINYIPGRDILRCFALYKDNQEDCTKYSECFDACLAVRKIKMEVTLESSLIKQKRSDINKILGQSEVVDHIEASNDIREKIANQTVQLSDIKKLQRQLVQFCELELFRHWKKTESREYIEREFKRNMIIDERMKELGVEIGA